MTTHLRFRRRTSTRGAEKARRATAGSVREVAQLAYPVVLTQLSMTTMGVVDSAMVGRLGATELAAVGFAGIWLWTLFCFFIGATTAVQTFVSQHDGAGERQRCGSWAWQGLFAVVPVALVGVFALWWGVDALLRILGPSQGVREIASSYMRVRAFGEVGMCAAMTFASFFRGIGDTRTPLWAALIANGVNLVLDYGLIFGRLGLPEWGVTGAAAATAIGEWIYAGSLLFAISRAGVRRRYATKVVAAHAPAMRRLLRIGGPIGGQWLLEMLSFAVFLTLVAHMGDAEMAASQAFISLLSLSFMQASGLAIAVATLVGQYIGARETEAVEHSFRSGLGLASLLSGSIALLFLLAPATLMRIFTDDPAVVALGQPLRRVGAVCQCFDAFGIVADGALRGAGDTRWPFLVRFALAWGLFVPLAWLLGIHGDGGLTAAWLAGALYVIVLALYLIRRFRSGAWRSIRI